MSDVLTGGTIVSADRVRLADETVRVGSGTSTIRAEPKIHLVREDGVIRAIDITCSCGERIRIHCEYS